MSINKESEQTLFTYSVRQMDKSTRVSVVIPTKDRPQSLELALDSVLAQTFKEFEIIIVNDGGCDVRSIAAKAANRGATVNYIVHNKSHGAAFSRNTGLAAARGLYIAYLDDDDIFYPHHLQALINAAETTESNFVYSRVCHRETICGSKSSTIYVRKEQHPAQDWTLDEMLASNRIPTLAVLHRRELLHNCGYFDEKLQTHEDWDLWIRLMRMGRSLYVPELTAEYRTDRRQRSLTSDQRHDFLKSMEIIHTRYLNLAVNPAEVAAAQKTARWKLECELTDENSWALKAHRLKEYIKRYFITTRSLS